MSPLEHPLGWALVVLSIPAAVVIAVVTEKYHTVRRNRRYAEKGYTR